MASRILVVCYSRGGTTLRVAEHVAEALGAELERIEEGTARTGLGGWARSALEAAAKGLPTIRTTKDPRAYDLVILGSPVWVGTMASPIRTYIYTHPGQLRSASFFAVMGGSGGEDAIREMQLACDASDGPWCVLRQNEVERGLHRATCESFIQALKERSRGTPPRMRSAA